MKVFRYETEMGGWLYKGYVNPETSETTFGQLLATDRVAYDFPPSHADTDFEMMETAQEAGLLCGA